MFALPSPAKLGAVGFGVLLTSKLLALVRLGLTGDTTRLLKFFTGCTNLRRFVFGIVGTIGVGGGSGGTVMDGSKAPSETLGVTDFFGRPGEIFLVAFFRVSNFRSDRPLLSVSPLICKDSAAFRNEPSCSWPSSAQAQPLFCDVPSIIIDSSTLKVGCTKSNLIDITKHNCRCKKIAVHQVPRPEWKNNNIVIESWVHTEHIMLIESQVYIENMSIESQVYTEHIQIESGLNTEHIILIESEDYYE
ncbi:hypothetical protein AGLY_011795 [Aphis glycines]|uniref:Uncharacterized protein n=1 Tax=Aphis glycines TaxID=307491 RepID=A0A6G0TB79_APHGL|nr:hypothetical protein AGLY_011795 [Aphis glycines]